MSCECMTNFEKGIVEKQPFTEFKGRVLAAEFDKALFFDGPNVRYKPTIEVELTIEGRKSTVRRGAVFSYCPFCGKPYDEPKEVSHA